MTHDQYKFPLLGAGYVSGIPDYRLTQHTTPRIPSTIREIANTTPQPQCGHTEAEAGVGANCRSSLASVESTIMLASWVVVETADKCCRNYSENYT